ncbi:transcriptional regulator, TetR family [Muriicola jejuensis]|uniref:TetR family transcriptional regulator n=1 Tax=Muriicola jejuensis TaxID=504488 RepID=A0A6P0UCQ8_9FLAO|nr:TetR/AcrR family transcriptional regulator [Muriicola jejuensis]NER10270.1 TetR family transcriptional regulator [Muriicola jejuensis]SMP01562.1 transcriptional regulator, TetR family [Muriicola jejuensis]
MKHLLQTIKIEVNNKTFVKDPESSALGKRIVEHSILMIHELGFDSFTFKKLGDRIGSNESSIYRYFENKHKLLLYLTSWYWGWLEYQFVFATNSIADPADKLRKAIEVVSKPVVLDASFSHINEVLLNDIIVNEYSKSYLTKEVDTENKEGYFEVYKRLVLRISEMIRELCPEYPFPSSLASTVLEGTLHQYFLVQHFPSLTDCSDGVPPTDYFTDLVFNSIDT